MDKRLEKAIERLSEDLKESADWNKMITVRREDLYRLMGAYFEMERELEERSKDDWCGSGWSE